MRKIFAIAWKDLYITFTDRNLLLIMIATPLALASIIGLAFSGLGGGSDVPIQNVPVALVNLDEGAEQNGQTVNLGDVFAQALIPPEGGTDAETGLFALTDTTLYSTRQEARAAVDRGDALAAIIVPADFSASLAITPDKLSITPVTLEVYTSPAAPVSGDVIVSVANSIGGQIVGGNIIVSATLNTLIDNATSNPALGLGQLAAMASGEFPPDFTPAFTDQQPAIAIDQQTISGEQAGFNALAFFGSAQALFFMMFSAMGSAASMLEEQRDGTLPRMLVTPTPRSHILLGKMLGTFVVCAVQVFLLMIALTAVGTLLNGSLQLIWGSNFLVIALVILAVALAATGIGSVVTGIARTSEQANIIGSVISMLFGLLGGAFFPVAVLGPLAILSRFTVNYWGVDAFDQLAQGGGLAGVLPNIGVLVAAGIVLFGLGFSLFNRRMEA
ncbi:MAG: ABC transporter permease [Pleurocapsa minor GSE-CHR-MK-17-07R]|jgi:ABC-2 type transport system permease protein|nr:ABC transporter permease [Pleurocapsa minor GSE-CHR-MK 17-07R]